MPNNYLSVLYKHIIQVENKNVGLKVGGHKHTIAPPVKKVGGSYHGATSRSSNNMFVFIRWYCRFVCYVFLLMLICCWLFVWVGGGGCLLMFVFVFIVGFLCDGLLLLFFIIIIFYLLVFGGLGFLLLFVCLVVCFSVVVCGIMYIKVPLMSNSLP